MTKHHLSMLLTTINESMPINAQIKILTFKTLEAEEKHFVTITNTDASLQIINHLEPMYYDHFNILNKLLVK